MGPDVGHSRCPSCGRDLAPESTYCRHCGRALTAGEYGSESRQYGAYTPYTPPESNLVWAILVTIFCCMPFGIVAIVYAAQVGSYMASGNYTAAQQSSDQARKWCLISLITGLALPLLYILFSGLAAIPMMFI